MIATRVIVADQPQLIASTLHARARAKSALPGLTCGYGGEWQESGLLNYGCALYLHGEHSTPAQVRVIWWSVWRRDGPDSAPDRSLSTPASEQVNRLSDDFARACVPNSERSPMSR
jgi:hypothetical protein